MCDSIGGNRFLHLSYKTYYYRLGTHLPTNYPPYSTGATMTVVALHASFFDIEALPQAEGEESFPMMIEQV